MVPPVLEQARRFRADMPLGGVGQGPPSIHVLTHFIDDGGRIVLLLFGGEALPFVEHHIGLLPGFFPLLRLRDRCDELSTSTTVQNLLCRLPLGVQLPVPLWGLVGRVQDGMVEEWNSQNDTPSEEDACNGSGAKFNFKIFPKNRTLRQNRRVSCSHLPLKRNKIDVTFPLTGLGDVVAVLHSH